MIKDKTLLTKELSPLFCGVSDAIPGEYLFKWIVATAPFYAAVYKMMTQLGDRIYFYEIVSVDFKEDDLIEFAK